MQKSQLAIAITSVIGLGGATLPDASLSATLPDGICDMRINNTCYGCYGPSGDDFAEYGGSFAFTGSIDATCWA